MKLRKLLIILSCAAILATFAACGETENNNNENNNDGSNQATEPTESDGQTDVTEPEVTEQPEEEEAPAITDSKEILTTVWGSYAEENKFSVIGGTGTMDEPDSLDVTADTDMISNNLVFPADSISMIDDAASLMHMLNANTFTCGVFRVTDSANITAVADAIKEKVTTNQWICGVPNEMFVANIGNYVVSAFGNDEVMDVFKTALETSYPDVTFLYEEAIA